MLSFLPLISFNHDLDSLPFKSQLGQDKFILQKFFTDKNGDLKKDGFYIEFGAIDGVYLSNTYALEHLGWKGICIEPIPEMFQELEKNRSCICLQGCVSDTPGVAIFREVGGTFEVLSGLENKYFPEEINLIENVYKKPSKFYEVQCFTLSQIMRDYNVENIHILFIDTEGGERGILESLTDEELRRIKMICVEDNFGDRELVRFLISKNFKFICRLDFDLIFQNNDFVD